MSQVVQVSFDVKGMNGDLRPIFSCKIGAQKVVIMFDSGAETSVWAFPIQLLLETFPNAFKLNAKFPITGFGQGVEMADMWNVGDLVLKGRGGSVTIKDFCVAVMPEKRFNATLILSMGIFSKSDILFSYSGNNKYIVFKCNKEIHYKLNLLNEQIQGVNIHRRDTVLVQAPTYGRYTCINRRRDRTGAITDYIILDRQTGQKRIVSSKQLKSMIKHKKVEIDNLILTSDNRLLYREIK